MNYILTMDEVKTLAGLLGARAIFSPGENEKGALTREATVRSVFQLTQRGFLIRGENGFACQPQVRELMGQMLRAAYGIVVLVPEEAQLFCYVSGEGCVILEMIGERPGEYKLYAQSFRETCEQLCPRADIRSGESPEMNVSELYFDALPSMEDLCIQIDIFSLAEQRQKARALVKRRPMGKVLGVYDGERISLEVYEPRRLYEMVDDWVGGIKL